MFALTRLVMSSAMRMVYPFLPTLARGLGVPLNAVALAVSARSALGIAGPLFGSVADTRGRKSALRLGLLIFSAGMLAVAIFPTYWVFLLGLLISAAGNIMADSAIYAHLGDQVPYERRGFAVAVIELGWSGAFVVGVPVIGWLIARAGPAAPFTWLAAVGLGIALAWQLILQSDTPGPGGTFSLVEGLRRIGAHKGALAGLVVALLIVTANQCVSIVYGAWMEGAFGLTVEEVGAASAVIGVAGIGGLGMVALLSDRIGKLRALTLGVGLNVMGSLSLPLLGQTLTGAMATLFFFYLTFEFSVISGLSLMTELVPEARATMMSASLAALAGGDAMGALVGSSLFASGIGPNAAIAVLLDLLALGIIVQFLRGYRRL